MNWGDITTKILIGEYIILFISYLFTDRVKALYWLGATLLTLAVLKM